MNFATGPSGEVDSRSSTSLSPTGKNAVVTFWASTVSELSNLSPRTSDQKIFPSSILLTAIPRWSILSISIVCLHGLVKSPYAALLFALSHCGVPISTPHSCGLVRLAYELFTRPLYLLTSKNAGTEIAEPAEIITYMNSRFLHD